MLPPNIQFKLKTWSAALRPLKRRWEVSPIKYFWFRLIVLIVINFLGNQNNFCVYVFVWVQSRLSMRNYNILISDNVIHRPPDHFYPYAAIFFCQFIKKKQQK